jgi:hypothetical protein
MTGRDDEAWIDSLLQRQLPPGPAEEAFQARVLRRLPPRERPGPRAFTLGLSWVLALAVLFLPWGGAELAAQGVGEQSLLIPCCLGTALLWYLADRRT